MLFSLYLFICIIKAYMFKRKNFMIETERLILRTFDDGDLDIIFKLYSDEEIMKYMPLPVMDIDATKRSPCKNYGRVEKSAADKL